MPVLEDLPLEEKVRRGNLILKSRVRDAEDSLAQLASRVVRLRQTDRGSRNEVGGVRRDRVSA